jgi:hypothetical protein
VTTEGYVRKVPLRRLLSKLTVLALTATPVSASPARARTPDEIVADDDDELHGDLPIDREHLDPHDAAAMLGRSLANALAELPPLHATRLATTWALSEDRVRRASVAAALEHTFPLLGDSIVIDHLSRDTDPRIRAICARAAWIRRATGGDPGVLDRLASDDDPEVRAIALRARPRDG